MPAASESAPPAGNQPRTNEQQPSADADSSRPTLLDEAEVRSRLERIARALTSDPDLCQDLIQEASLHFWRQERLHPGQKQSWYLVGCWNYLRNYLRLGFCLDSLKRRHLACAGLECLEESADAERLPEPEESFFEALATEDELNHLCRALPAVGQTIFLQRYQGCQPREIARTLHISTRAVNYHLAMIRKVALRLGMRPKPHALCLSE